jgi:hypothetical protein
MKGSMRDPIHLKRSQYSSRILITPNNKQNNQKPTKRGISSEPYSKSQEQLDNESINITSLITQSTKNGRPLTGMNINSYGQNVKYF